MAEAVAFYNTVGNGHAINSCNFYRIRGLTGRGNIVKVLSVLVVAADCRLELVLLHRVENSSPYGLLVRLCSPSASVRPLLSANRLTSVDTSIARTLPTIAVRILRFLRRRKKKKKEEKTRPRENLFSTL